MNNREVALVGAAVCSSLAVGYLLGKLHGSRRYADDYVQRPGREFKKTEGLKTFLEYVAKYSSPEHHSVTELRKVGNELTELKFSLVVAKWFSVFLFASRSASRVVFLRNRALTDTVLMILH